MSYSQGVLAIKELMGANEDISRLDFAITVASNEVPSEAINVIRTEDNSTTSITFAQNDCRALVLWAWSRKREQVTFTIEATKEVIEQAVIFGKRYSPNIPLVQGENIRIKLAKIAAAVAARVFSTDDAFERLTIEKVHVQFAVSFLREVYSKLSMAYDQFSEQQAVSEVIGDANELANVFEELKDHEQAAIKGLASSGQFLTQRGLADWVGGESIIAETLIGSLVRLHCLRRDERTGRYQKMPAFNEWLRRKTKEQNSA